MNINPHLIHLIEDDPLIIRLYERVLRLHNFEVAIATNGEEAILMLTALKELPVLILLDIMMPKLSGFDVIKFIKENEGLRDIPVIMLSNLSNKEDQVRAISMGAALYVVKSHHTPKELMELIEDFLSKRAPAPPAA